MLKFLLQFKNMKVKERENAALKNITKSLIKNKVIAPYFQIR